MTARAAEKLERVRRLERPLVVALVVTGIGMAALAAVALIVDRPSRALLETVFLVLAGVGVASLIAVVLWLRWFIALHRVAREVGRTRHGSFMSGLGWIVPVVLLVVPKRMVDDVWRAGGDDRPLPRAVQWWWAIWFTLNATETSEFVLWVIDRSYEAPAWLDVAGYLLFLLATPFAVKTVYALTDRLEEVVGPGASSGAVPPESGYAMVAPT